MDQRIAKPGFPLLRLVLMVTSVGFLGVMILLTVAVRRTAWVLMASQPSPDGIYAAGLYRLTRADDLTGCHEAIFVALATQSGQSATAPDNMAYRGSCGGLAPSHSIFWTNDHALTVSFAPDQATTSGPAELRGSAASGKVRIHFALQP